ncbi:alpha/beta fold hydrolase [Mycoplasmatota bacterium]|nr:alpha/beta fold hydrolase [Mycoplasmatota bacterium]
MQIYKELKTNEGILRGYLHQPDINGKMPLVVMYHGFTGHKGENAFLFTQFSRYLCDNNIASLRFDFLGSGESDHDFKYMTFSKEVEEAKAILTLAKTFPFVRKIIVMGLSMGGAVATQVAKERASEIDKLILWAPAGNIREIIENSHFSTSENGNCDLGGIELSSLFIDDIKEKDLWTGIDQFKKPVSIHHGSNDTAVPLIISEKYKEIYQNCKLHIYQNGTHTFTNVMIRNKLFADNVKFISD